MKKNLILVAIVFSALFAFSGCGRLNHYKRSNEIMLQQNLSTMRRAIEFYANDRGKKPQSLNELVGAGYLREIPTDPFTRSDKTWAVETEKESSVPNARPELLTYTAARLVQIRMGSLIIGIDKYPLKEIGYGSFK